MFGGSSNSQFEPADKNSNSRGFLQSAQPYGSKFQFENGANAPEFEPFAKNGTINSEKGGLKSKLAKLEPKTKTFTLSVVKPKTKTKK